MEGGNGMCKLYNGRISMRHSYGIYKNFFRWS